MKQLLNVALVCLLAGCGSESVPNSVDDNPPAISSHVTMTVEPGVATAQPTPTAVPVTETPTPVDEPQPVNAAPAEKAERKVELKVLDFDGVQQLVKSYKGKVVVMDCWATYCAPCIEEFPNLVKLHQKYGPEKVVCISLSFDYDSAETIENQSPPILKFLQEQKATFDNVLAKEDPDGLYEKFQLVSIPAVFVYDQEGKLLEKFTNHGAYVKVNPLVEKLLSK